MLLDELHHARGAQPRPRAAFQHRVRLHALALAGTATLLNLLEAFVFRKLAVAAPEPLVGIYPASNEFSTGFSLAALQALRARQQALTDLCG